MVLDAAKLAYATKTKKSVASKKSKSAIRLLLNDPEECPASDKAQLFAKNFSSNSKLNDLCISLPIFLYRTNLKLHNISITPKMVTKVIIITHARHLVLIVFQLWFYRTVSLNFHIYYLNSSICAWKNLVFQIVERSHQWSLYLRMLEEGLLIKTTTLIKLLVT